MDLIEKKRKKQAAILGDSEEDIEQVFVAIDNELESEKENFI